MAYLDLEGAVICTRCLKPKPATLDYFHSHGFYNSRKKIADECKECRKGENKRYYNTEEKKVKYRLQKRKYDLTKGYIKKLLKSYRQRDAKNGYEFNLTEDWVKENITGKPCYYCGISESQEGVERLDNDKGHTTDNCVPCCRVCNVVRSNIFTVEEMKEIGKVIFKLKQKREILKSYNRSKSELYDTERICSEISSIRKRIGS